MNFTKEDIKQIEKKGLTVDKVLSQLELFKKGIPFVNLKSAATVGDGIWSFNEEDINELITLYNSKKDNVSIVKFVPASGAATRMFKALFQFLEGYNPKNKPLEAYLKNSNNKELAIFFEGLNKLPFFNEVILKLNDTHSNYNTLSSDEQQWLFVKTMLDKNLLNFSSSPKGLLPFHQYKNYVLTAFEEHLFEAAKYASSKNEADLHFTVSKTHQQKFSKKINTVKDVIEHSTLTKFNISFSYQKQATDTIAVTLSNEPLRDKNKKLVFRPSGHGALIENLNNIDADVIFIKNIDNVVVSNYVDEVAKYKKMLGGILLKIQENIFNYQHILDTKVSNEQLIEITNFLTQKLNIVLNYNFNNLNFQEKKTYLKSQLNKPIRVCGMVKNQGEPGGGPFWVKDASATVSLQIVESAQIDKNDPQQIEILKNATHFNPVDLVCGVKNYKGEKYDLTKFIDKNTAFITTKTKSGKDLKALELPGLWNGSMAYWNTIFVEVPLITFNPIKTVNDLLKETHQVKIN
ncbi:DUF4301 family protein [Pontimicrobium aquaticum]|uniref:DUF4301 family protein n=1 Tax=Pontimicrobium aquaticum TaxID=2565367 RepID=A0A4U0F2J8_9FLAO|nr:DUF4301 family protein [Pontimicrobium aquaticum]TJY38004.1 DUF4301 family protein [Pontimicrobium aquaticum]